MKLMREIHAIKSNVLLLHLVNTNKAIASWSIFQFTGSETYFYLLGWFKVNVVSCHIQ